MQLILQILLIVLLLLFSLNVKIYYLNQNHFFDYMLLCIITVMVYGNLSLHTFQKEIRSVLKSITLTIIGFAFLRIIKLHLPEGHDSLDRYLWYCFYPCLLLLGYYSMRIVQILDISFTKSHKRDWFKYILYLDIAVILLVFTNDYHQLMFVFSINWENTRDVYSGGILEWPIKLYIMLQFIIPASLLLKDAIKFSYFRLKMLLPMAILGYAIFYQVAYSLRIAPFRPSETVLVTCSSLITFWYCAFTTDLIIFNDKYMELFYASGIHTKIAEARLRQNLFLKLESIVAEEKQNIIGGIHLLKQDMDLEARLLLLQHLRLSSSLIKKQCLLFLQGEIYGYVPMADYLAALKEGVRYVKEYNSFFSLHSNIQGKGFKTNVALATHNLVLHAFMLAVKKGFEELIINVNGASKGLELVIMVDTEHREDMELLYEKKSKMLRLSGVYSLVFRTTEDAVTLRLVIEEANYDT